MRKKLITLVIIAGVIGTPMLAMSISPTRDLLLGMTSDEAVLALADEIDESRVDNENKIQELQSIIDNQSIELTNYREQVEEQNNEIENVNTSVKNTNETIEKQKDCNVDISKYCVSDSFKSYDEFSSFLTAYEKFNNYSEYKTKYTNQFNNCQKALKCE